MKKFCFIVLAVVLLSIRTNAQHITVVKDYKYISSIPQLLSEVKGRFIFLDLWAPWCEPCKEKFKYSDMLYKELKKRKITVLYVSLNSNVKEDEWKDDINNFKLKGVHVLASKQLEDSLTKKIWGHSGGYSIPRYLLLDSTGKILIADAPAPDQKIILLSEIDKDISAYGR